MANLSISWPSFETSHEDIHKAFEDMCGSLFKKMFAPEGTILLYNPQNPGVECEPIQDRIKGERISFQAKYFESRTKYDKIRKSALEIVKHYSGRLDKVYLYCNRDLKLDGKQYHDIESLLSTARIALVPITNQAILDEVHKYSQIAKSYFNQLHISQTWFQETLLGSLTNLYNRYNGSFNIVTETERTLDLFFQNSEAADAINRKKEDTIKSIEHNRWLCPKYVSSLQRVIEFIEDLPDIDRTRIQDSYNWENQVSCLLSNEISEAQLELENIENQKPEEICKDRRELIRSLRWFIHIPESLRVSEYERNLLEKRTLLLSGKTGAGKSQALANMAAKSNNEGNAVLLVLGNQFLSDDPISIQMTQQVSVNIEIDDFLDICNEYGNKGNYYFVICIDAINESANKDVWKTGLAGFIAAVEKRSNLKLLISYRDGYKKRVLSDSIIEMEKNHSILSLHHDGFQNESPDAVQEFLNYYGVPFSPEYYFQQEMTNPLFLRLFCKAYDGSSIDISTLIDRIIEQTDSDIAGTIGLTDSGALLKKLLKELSEKRLKNNMLSFPDEVLYKLAFWDTYGLSHIKLSYVSSLVNFGILSSFMHEDEEYFYFSFNLIEEYLCAKTIMQSGKTKGVVQESAREIILGKDGHGAITSNIGIFIALCSLFAEKYGEECISIADEIDDQFDRREIEKEYIESFSWRKGSAINEDHFRDYVNNKNLEPSLVFSLLMECSTKTQHPLDAFFLHKILIDKTLAQRDLVWTCCINNLPEVCQRFYSIILYMEKGGNLNGLSNDSTLRLAIALTWLLSSSNRVVRDRTSKALIELCKEHFEISLQLLMLFDNVNDPYIVQRLYGVVVGACTKRTKEHSETYRKIIDFVYQHVFCQETVYPDILMRDYARLIIERYIYEYPDTLSDYDLSKIVPPYTSVPIPHSAQKDYKNIENSPSGFETIMRSMRPDTKEFGLGMYGDFGRYVFQAAASHFKDVDITNLYYYALDYILNDLGYRDDYFTNYDVCSHSAFLDRHELKKTERIGKKYQWISFFNILARLSDANSLLNWNNEDIKYEGPIEPLVRDFDPTFNEHFTQLQDIPSFNKLEKPSIDFIHPNSTEDEARKWVDSAKDFFENQSKRLLFVDDEGVQWVSLHRIDRFQSMRDMWDHSLVRIKKGAQEVLSFSNAFFIHRNDLGRLKRCLHNIRLNEINFPGKAANQLYSREFYWSYALRSVLEDDWLNLEVPSGKTRTVSIEYSFDDFLSELMASYGGSFHDYQEMIMKNVCKIMPSYCSYTWEAEYDSSSYEVSSYELPCKEIVENLQLTQKEYDGYFFSKEGILVAYDSTLEDQDFGLLIRKDYLDKFLFSNKLVMCWECTGEKQFIRQDKPLIASNWDGLFVLKKNAIEGIMTIRPRKNMDD